MGRKYDRQGILPQPLRRTARFGITNQEQIARNKAMTLMLELSPEEEAILRGSGKGRHG